LRDVADPRIATTGRFAKDVKVAGERMEQAEDEPDQSRLSSAVRTEDRGERAGRDRETGV
jgi:hypothetical protein